MNTLNVYDIITRFQLEENPNFSVIFLYYMYI